MTLTSIGIIIGYSLGGVGIAAMGGAIGLPLFLVLGTAGFLGGGWLDKLINCFSKNESIEIPKDLYKKMEDIFFCSSKNKICNFTLDFFKIVTFEINLKKKLNNKDKISFLVASLIEHEIERIENIENSYNILNENIKQKETNIIRCAIL